MFRKQLVIGKVHKLPAIIGSLGLLGAVHASISVPLPENPAAFGNCTAKVKVDVARLRTGPSLVSRVVGVRLQDENLYVVRVQGKWVQVITPAGDTAFMAAYLLAFPYHDLLEHWKRETPSPSVGKKAKVKWAAANVRIHEPHRASQSRFRQAAAPGWPTPLLVSFSAWSKPSENPPSRPNPPNPS